jgi:hypothetical protein
LIDTIRYIPLETHPDALLPGYPYKFATIGGDLFIAGGEFMVNGTPKSPIYRFDSLGRFVKQVTYHGRGPNEILMPMGWYANSRLKQISVVSNGSYLVVTSTETGERSAIKIDAHQGGFFDRVPLNDSTFVSVRNSNNKDVPKTYLYFIDQRGELVHATERNDVLSGYSRETSEYAWALPYEDYWLKADYRGDAIFHDIFNDTLYRVKSYREITPHLVFKRGSLSPRPEDTHKPENKKKQVYFTSVKESGDNVFINYYLGGKIWCDVWLKSGGTLEIHTIKKKPSSIEDFFIPFALPDGSEIDLEVVYADKTNIYCVLEALDACKFLPGVKEDDNPVIVIAKLKK